MTIDERLERMAERHEALSQSVELLVSATRENTAFANRYADRHEALAQSVEMLLVSTRENTAAIRENGENIRKLVEVTNVDAENIRTLARVAEAHERRITDIEGKA